MIRVYIDGSSRSDGLASIGVVIKNGEETETIHEVIGHYDNHYAEFFALHRALDYCLQHNFHTISIHTDSQTVYDAVESKRIRKRDYQLLLEKILDQIFLCPLFFIKWIPSAQNKQADELARTALYNYGKE